MNLGSVMKKNVITVAENDSIAVAARRMRETDVGCLVAVRNRIARGVITDRDITVGCVGQGHNPQQCQVSEHMSTPVITAEPTLDIVEAGRLMNHKRIKRLPVTRDGELIGIISLSDVAEALDRPMHDILLGVGAARRLEEPEPALRR